MTYVGWGCQAAGETERHSICVIYQGSAPADGGPRGRIVGGTAGGLRGREAQVTRRGRGAALRWVAGRGRCGGGDVFAGPARLISASSVRGRGEEAADRLGRRARRGRLRAISRSGTFWSMTMEWRPSRAA